MSDYKKERKILEKTKGKCFYCGVVLPPDTEYLDDGGKVVSSKGTKIAEEFMS